MLRDVGGKVMYYKKLEEYETIKIKLPKSVISHIKTIGELQNIEFDACLKEIINTGISLKSNNFLLTSREIKIRALDNMLSQVYPLLYKTYPHNGVNVPVFDKICTWMALMTGHFVQKPQDDNNEIIGMQGYEIIKYVALNFNSDFNLIKKTFINMPRTKLMKAIYKPIDLKNNTESIIYNNTKRLQSEIPGKFKEECIVRGKYKKLDGTFGETIMELPALKPKNKGD